MINGIVALADRIVGNGIAVDQCEEAAQVPRGRDVYAAKRPRNRSSGGRVGRSIQHRLHALNLKRCERAKVISGGRSERTEEPAIHFVAYRYHIWHHTRRPISLKLRLDVVIDSCLRLSQRVSRPRAWSRGRRCAVEEQRQLD